MKLFSFLIFFSAPLFAQQSTLYMPLNIEDTYYLNTRSYTGKPGDNYWINSAVYKIKAEVIPEERKVIGSEAITYFNNSPDNLLSLVLNIYQDFYKKGTMRDWQIDKKAVNEGVIISRLEVKGKLFEEAASNGAYERYGTKLTIRLNEPLKAGESINIEVDWSFTIPLESRLRMGMYDESTFFVAFWYPQISVYDDIDGWDINHYKGTAEMYNDFNSYEVEITVPKNYLVWATGLLQNAEDVLQEKIYRKFIKASESDERINVISQADISEGNITKGDNKTTWIYKAESVPDFTFALSGHYLWDATSLEVEPGRRVFIDAAYNKNSKDFYEVASIARKTIEYLSSDLPGIPFPYPAMTVFNGHGGMEYPMMVNDGTTYSRARTVGLTAHEITHTYFPFYTGTNEKKYAWMDEGWAVVIPYSFQEKETPEVDPTNRHFSTMFSFSGQEYEVAPMVPNNFLTGTAYRNAAYSRPAMAYYYLKDFLGENVFRSALKEFINRWKGKHPIPYDFFFTFNDVLGEDLSWYWKPWFFDPGFADLSIQKVFAYEDSYEIYIEKIGSLPVPVNLELTYTDGSKKTLYKTADIWKEGNDEYIFRIEKKKKIKSATLGHPRILDMNKSNNYVIVE